MFFNCAKCCSLRSTHDCAEYRAMGKGLVMLKLAGPDINALGVITAYSDASLLADWY